MKLKNYTTSVSVDKSIMEIERFLTMFGATHVMKEFLSDGTVKSLSFKIQNKGYKLPMNVEGVEKIMFKRSSLTPNQRQQAYKTTWRIIRDWVHSQLSLLASGQAQPEEVLLPYLWDGKRTLYQAWKNNLIQIADKTQKEEIHNEM